jgi:imidazole glycerol phosphate synthase glutamine amidotransferase subunit
MHKRTIIIQTGLANTASVLAGLERAGAKPEISQNLRAVRDAPFVVLPGVGAFGAGMDFLNDSGLGDAVRERVETEKPLLAVCLGLQLLFEGSEESPGVAGLGIIKGQISRFPRSVLTPQLGWNEVKAEEGARLLDSGYAYFANSYRAISPTQGWIPARADHGGEFVAALERGSALCCQFHPELSGKYGADLLRRWLND